MKQLVYGFLLFTMIITGCNNSYDHDSDKKTISSIAFDIQWCNRELGKEDPKNDELPKLRFELISHNAIFYLDTDSTDEEARYESHIAYTKAIYNIGGTYRIPFSTYELTFEIPEGWYLAGPIELSYEILTPQKKTIPAKEIQEPYYIELLKGYHARVLVPLVQEGYILTRDQCISEDWQIYCRCFKNVN